MRKYRRLDRFSSVDFDLPVFYGGQHFLVAFQVHGLGQAVADGLENERMVRKLDSSGESIVLALDLGRKDGRQQIVGPHTL